MYFFCFLEKKSLHDENIMIFPIARNLNDIAEKFWFNSKNCLVFDTNCVTQCHTVCVPSEPTIIQ